MDNRKSHGHATWSSDDDDDENDEQAGCAMDDLLSNLPTHTLAQIGVACGAFKSSRLSLHDDNELGTARRINLRL